MIMILLFFLGAGISILVIIAGLIQFLSKKEDIRRVGKTLMKCGFIILLTLLIIMGITSNFWMNFRR